MPTLYPNSGALFIAGTMKTALAASKLRLVKIPNFSPAVNTQLATLEAGECDFSGYPAGGLTIANFTDPLLNPVGGASIESGTKQFAYVAPVDPEDAVGNVVTGWFLVDATGKLIQAGNFPNGIAVTAPGLGVPMNVLMLFGSVP